jgi:hypothetical protein
MFETSGPCCFLCENWMLGYETLKGVREVAKPLLNFVLLLTGACELMSLSIRSKDP